MIASWLFDLTWKVAIVFAFATLLSGCRRRASPAQAHALWVIALVGFALLPILSLLLPDLPVRVLEPTSTIVRDTSQHRVGVLPPVELDAAIDAPPLVAPTELKEPQDESLANDLVGWLWGLGLAFGLLRLEIGRRRIRRLIRGARPAEACSPVARAVARKIGLHRPFRTLQSPLCSAPFSAGVIHPVIVLPEGQVRWSTQRLRAIVAHEAAHLRRGDVCTAFAARLVRAFFWFHPLVWFVHRRLETTSERACDDEALTTGLDPGTYATDLLTLAREALRVGLPKPSSIAPAAISLLERRVRSILDPLALRAPATRGAVLLAVVIIAPLTAWTASVLPVARHSTNTSDAVSPLRIGEAPPGIEELRFLNSNDAGGSWERFRGRAVVLQFFATVCAFDLQRFNDLCDEFAREPVAFVLVSFEDLTTVNRFFDTYPTSATVAVDVSRTLVDRFEAHIVPHTILVDRGGKVAAITSPDHLDTSVINGLIEGKPLGLHRKTSVLADVDWDRHLETTRHVVLEASLADSGAARFAPGSGHITGDGLRLANMIQLAHGAAPHEIDASHYPAYEDDRTFRLSVRAPDGSDETARRLLQSFLRRHYAVDARFETTENVALVLTCTETPSVAMTPTRASEPAGILNAGMMQARKVSFSRVVAWIANVTQTDVVDQTQLDGDFDIDISWVPGDRDSFLAALGRCGLHLEKEQTTVRRLVLRSLAR